MSVTDTSRIVMAQRVFIFLFTLDVATYKVNNFLCHAKDQIKINDNFHNFMKNKIPKVYQF
jgi:hypothetical protein